MKLVTFQTIEALKALINNGYLECDEFCVDTNKMGVAYEWVLEQMEKTVPKDGNAKYPLWAWVKFKNGIYPPKHKRLTQTDETIVKITFTKDKKDVFITDYRRYSFVLNNLYIPKNLEEKERFSQKLENLHITQADLQAYVRKDKYAKHRTDTEYLELCAKIRKSWERCITEDSDVLQACVWRINLSDVSSIDILHDRTYDYGTYNYVRSNGKRFDWREEFYKSLIKSKECSN